MAHNTTSFFLCCSFCLFTLINAISYCKGPCNDLNDCYGQLICINGKCNDAPDLGTHICPTTTTPSPPPPSGSGGTTSRPSGTLYCGTDSYPQYKCDAHTPRMCSPPVSSSTRAILTLNDFSEGGDGGGPSECDGNYHSNSERVVALSIGWHNNGSRCFKMIRITASNGRSVNAKVVDECDSVNGCDAEHAGQPPCRNNVVDGSQAVSDALGLNTDDGVVDVTWSMASK